MMIEPTPHETNDVSAMAAASSTNGRRPSPLFALPLVSRRSAPAGGRRRCGRPKTCSGKQIRTIAAPYTSNVARHPTAPLSAAVIGQNTLDDSPVTSMSPPIDRLAPAPTSSLSRM
jgi:hypothetical protein